MSQQQVNTLLGKLLQKGLYVVFSTPLKSMSEMMPISLEHLYHVIDLERRGILFASSPFI